MPKETRTIGEIWESLNEARVEARVKARIEAAVAPYKAIIESFEDDNERLLGQLIEAELESTAQTSRDKTMNEPCTDRVIVTDKCDGNPVLFLDIDGTLGPRDQRVPMSGFSSWGETTEALSALLGYTDAMVVLCTTRVGQEDLVGHVRRLSCPESPWRISGQCCHPRMLHSHNMMTAKEAMVTTWLQTANEQCVRPSRWAIFDDEPHPSMHWSVAGRWVVPDGPLHEGSREWWLLWSMLSGFPARMNDRLRYPYTVATERSASDLLGFSFAHGEPEKTS